MSLKKVDIDKLDTFRHGLNKLKYDFKQENLEKLIEYYDKHILKEENEKLNSLKRLLYTLMKRYETSDQDKSRSYYCIYESLKKGFLTYDKALEKTMNI